MTDDDLFRALAARLQPYLTVARPPADAGTNPPPPANNPPPPPTAGISARWDSAPSQWAKWNFVTASETTALQAIHGVTPVAQRINWYQGYHRLDGLQKADGSYWFVNGYTAWGTPDWRQDVGGTADAKHLADLGSTPEIAALG